MKKNEFGFRIIGILVCLISCTQTPKSSIEIKQADLQHKKHFVSIDGVWRVTPETSIKYPHGILEPILQIDGDIQGKISARGCFLWESRFYDYWNFDSIQYCESTNELFMVYDDGGTYLGTVDQSKEMIQGMAYWYDGENRDTDRIDFIRDEDFEIDRMFTPYSRSVDGSVKYVYCQPENCNDQLQTASIFGAIKDTAAFYHLMERIIRQEFGRLESFLIIKNQRLVLEEYFYAYDQTQLHPVHSVTKSITALLLGIALERNNKLNVDRPVFDFFPQFDSLIMPEKAQITLKHVLTMTSGLPEKDDFEKNDPSNLVKQMLVLPQESVPGEEFNYNGNNTNLLGSIIYTLEKKQADDFAKEVLFSKLDISEFWWEKENGVLPCHSELHMLPRDMAKIGLLVVNNGSWNEEQIVPKKWIEMSGKPHVSETEFFDYGFQWWYRSKQNTAWWKNPVHGCNDEHDMFLSLGYGGQYIMIVKDLDMVIVITSSDYNEGNGMAHQKIPMVIEGVVPLFEN